MKVKKKVSKKSPSKSAKSVSRESFDAFKVRVFDALTKTPQTSNELGAKLGLADKKGNVAPHRKAKLCKALGALIAAGKAENTGAYKTSAYIRLH